MQRFRTIILSTLLLLAAAGPACAGAWLEEKGNTLAIAQLTYFTSDAYFDSGGDRHAQDRFTKAEFQPYVEYGLTDAFTLGATSYLHRVEQTGDSNYGIGDTSLFLRTRLWQDEKNILSLQPLLKLPSAYRDDTLPRGASRSTDGELSLLYGRTLSLFSGHDYLDTALGYRLRNHDLSAQYRADAALGLRVSDSWLLIPALHLIASPSVSGSFSENGEQSYDLLKAELGAAYMLNDGRWVQVSIFDHLYGKETGTGQGVSIAVAGRF